MSAKEDKTPSKKTKSKRKLHRSNKKRRRKTQAQLDALKRMNDRKSRKKSATPTTDDASNTSNEQIPNIQINIKKGPITRQQKQQINTYSELLDVTTLNQTLQKAQELHNKNHKKCKGVLQISCITKSFQTGRFIQVYCVEKNKTTTTTELIYEQISNPNVEVVVNDDKYDVNQLDIQWVIMSEECGLRYRNLRKAQLCLGVSPMTRYTYYKYVCVSSIK